MLLILLLCLEAASLAQSDSLKLDQHYERDVIQADSLFEQEKWFDAREAYEHAISLRPEQTYPLEQIALIDEILWEESRWAEYLEMIEYANTLFDQGEYQYALNVYEDALQAYPDEQFPKDRIDELEVIIAETRGSDE